MLSKYRSEHEHYASIYGMSLAEANERIDNLRLRAIENILSDEYAQTDITVDGEFNITHKVWLTNPDNPAPFNSDILGNLIQTYKSLDRYRHIFWTNYPDILLDAFKAIESEGITLEVHHVDELENTPGKTLLDTYMKNNMFAFASDILRLQILCNYGGLYSDCGWIIDKNITKIIGNFDYVITSFGGVSAGHAFMFMKKGNNVCKAMLSKIDDPEFMKLYIYSYIIWNVIELVDPKMLTTVLAALPDLNTKFLILNPGKHTYREMRLSTWFDKSGKFGNNPVSEFDKHVKKFIADYEEGLEKKRTASTLVSELLSDSGEQKIAEGKAITTTVFTSEIEYEITSLTANLGADDFIDLDQVSPRARQQILTTTQTDPKVVQGLYQAVKDVTEVLTYFGIDHWAVGGTLRGAVRLKYGSPSRGGMSPWSNDADFAVNQKDEEKLKSPVLEELFDKLGYGLCSDEDTPESYVGYKVYAKQMVSLGEKEAPVFVDLFLSQREGDRYVLTRPLGREFFKDAWFFFEEVEKKETYTFGEINIPGPSSVDVSLSRNYGPEWYDLNLYHNSHFGKIPFKYKWSFQSDEERRPALPSAPLEERLKNYLENTVHSQNENTDFAKEMLSQKESAHIKMIKYFLDI